MYMEILHERAEKNEKKGRKEQRKKDNMRKIKAEREREEEDASRKTACTLPKTELVFYQD